MDLVPTPTATTTSVTDMLTQLLANMDKKHKVIVDFASGIIAKLKTYDNLWHSQRDGSPQLNLYINGMEPMLRIAEIKVEDVLLTEILGAQPEQLKTAFDFLSVVQKKYKGTGFEIKLQCPTAEGLFDGILSGVTPHRGFVTFSGKILGKHNVNVAGNFQPTKAMLGIMPTQPVGIQGQQAGASTGLGIDLSTFGSF